MTSQVALALIGGTFVTKPFLTQLRASVVRFIATFRQCGNPALDVFFSVCAWLATGEWRKTEKWSKFPTRNGQKERREEGEGGNDHFSSHPRNWGKFGATPPELKVNIFLFFFFFIIEYFPLNRCDLGGREGCKGDVRGVQEGGGRSKNDKKYK